MDLSKLPKLSESPATPPAAAPTAEASANPVPAQPAATGIPLAEAGVDALISLVGGGIFLMFGAPYGGWLIAKASGKPYVYDESITWLSGPLQGQVVEYFDLQGGTAWFQMGMWVLGACLIIEAFLILGAAVLPRMKKGLVVLAILLCVGGAVANVIAVAMQIRMNFHQPIYSMVGILVGGLIAFFHGRHLMAPAR